MEEEAAGEKKKAEFNNQLETGELTSWKTRRQTGKKKRNERERDQTY